MEDWKGNAGFESLDKICSFAIKSTEGFPGSSVVKNLPASAGDSSSVPDVGKSHMPGATGPKRQPVLQSRGHIWSPGALEPVLCSGEAAAEKFARRG